jgi:hypothetical protein
MKQVAGCVSRRILHVIWAHIAISHSTKFLYTPVNSVCFPFEGVPYFFNYIISEKYLSSNIFFIYEDNVHNIRQTPH